MANESGCGDLSQYQNIPLGVIYMVHGTLYYPFYLLSAAAIWSQPLINMACYKIMGMMAILDLTNLTIASYISSIWSILGVSWCHNYLIMKLCGAVTDCCWVSYLTLCILLGVHRSVDLSSSYWSEQLFDGRKAWCWITAAFLYGAAFGGIHLTKHATLVYHSGIGSLIFDPKGPALSHLIGTWTNVSTVIGLVICYSIVLYRMLQLSAQRSDQPTVSSRDRRVIVQCATVCALAALTCISYITVPLITTKVWVFSLCQLAWQMTQGSNGIIYLALNKTIRKRAKVILGLQNTVGDRSTKPATRKNTVGARAAK